MESLIKLKNSCVCSNESPRILYSKKGPLLRFFLRGAGGSVHRLLQTGNKKIALPKIKHMQTILVIDRSMYEKEKGSLPTNITMFVRQKGMRAFLLRENKVLSTQI